MDQARCSSNLMASLHAPFSWDVLLQMKGTPSLADPSLAWSVHSAVPSLISLPYKCTVSELFFGHVLTRSCPLLAGGAAQGFGRRGGGAGRAIQSLQSRGGGANSNSGVMSERAAWMALIEDLKKR